MSDSPFTIKIEPESSKRYRWKIFQDDKQRDVSLYTFETRNAARKDAQIFVDLLNVTWSVSS